MWSWGCCFVSRFVLVEELGRTSSSISVVVVVVVVAILAIGLIPVLAHVVDEREAKSSLSQTDIFPLSPTA